MRIGGQDEEIDYELLAAQLDASIRALASGDLDEDQKSALRERMRELYELDPVFFQYFELLLGCVTVMDLAPIVDDGEKTVSRKNFSLMRILRKHLDRKATIAIINLFQPLSVFPFKLDLRLRKNAELDGLSLTGHSTRLLDEWIAYDILQRVDSLGETLSEAVQAICDEGGYNLGEESIRKAYQRHIQQAKARGYLFEKDRVLEGISPGLSITLENLPQPGRRRKK
ncbi:hypothetical protein HFP51_00285 [Parasphingopyxis sp. CP4]|uniref:hypothetical protein n=1 Tax=Parasphingopyxis sp. CP4 TaxID=2724527 RepID=UPI00159FBEDF|nr:hypothetical protein [Parasphingopyxis sp. CP4]QLC20756.1 hypothetical protein HFP51_00285 [Parasphingopyxis sp. CP4]